MPLGDYVEKYCRLGQATDDITRRMRMRIACWIPRAANHNVYHFRSFILSMRNVADKSCRKEKKNKTHFMSFFFFVRKSSRLGDYVEKYCSSGHR